MFILSVNDVTNFRKPAIWWGVGDRRVEMEYAVEIAFRTPAVRKKI